MTRRGSGGAIALLVGLRLAIPWAAGATVPCNGNGTREGTEQCDDALLGPAGTVNGYSCRDFCFDGGKLDCVNCQWSTAGCCVCGNGILEPDCSEHCDGADTGVVTCQSLGYEGGTPGCLNHCQAISPNPCYYCGDGTKNGNEECDTGDFGSDQCNKVYSNGKFEHGGPLVCTTGTHSANPPWIYPDGCQTLRTSCYVCPDGHLDPGEQCDDNDNDDNNGCTNLCQLPCGDGRVQLHENCDDGNTIANDGCASCLFSPTLKAGGYGEASDECMMRWALAATPGSATDATPPATEMKVTCHDVGVAAGTAKCDQDDTTNGACRFEAYFCFNKSRLTQTGTCFPTNIASASIISANTTISAADQAGVLTAVENALVLGGANPATMTRTSTSRTPASPVATGSICNQFSVTVSRGSPPATVPVSAVLELRVTDSSGTIDTDRIRFECQP